MLQFIGSQRLTRLSDCTNQQTVNNKYVLSCLYRLPRVPKMHWGCYSTTKKEKGG